MKLPNAPAAVLEEFEPRILYTADAAALVLATDGEPLVRQLQALHSQNPVQQQPTVRELVVVDLSLPDAQVLLAGLQAQREAGRAIDILTLDARTDGIAAIGQALEGRNGVEAVHVLSHGEPGVLRLGAVQLDAGSLLARADELAAWSLALSAEADLLLYGCDVGAAAGGSQLLNALAQLTGADVAASTDDTGAAMLGGNWHLERSTGEVQAPLAIDVPTQQAWGQLMAASDAPVIVVNTTANKSQTTAALNRGSQQAVAHDAQGNFVVVWSSLNQDGSDWGVYARRFDIYGNPLSGEIQVNALTNRAQQYARVASDDAGNFVVTWTSDRQDGEGAGVYARTFRADGTPMSGDILVNTTTDGDQRNSVIGMNRSTGAFVVAWQGNGTSDNDGVFYRRFDSTGAALDINERRAHGATSGAQTNPAVAMDRSDRFVITWNDDDKVYFQRFNASGTMNGSRAQADAILSTSSAPALAMEDAGNFTIVYRETQIATGIWGRGFMANGTQRYTWFQAAGGDASSPSIEMAANGEFVVTWQAGGVADQDIYARRYSANGNANGAAFIVNTYTNNLQQAPSVAVLDSEHFAVVWSGKTTGDVTAVMARAYVAAPANPVITSDGGGANASLTVTENTTAVTTVTATDINRPAQTLSFSISGGDDAAKFAIDASTGVLRFLAAPNREAPADANEDHVYEVSVRVSDGSLNDTQDLLVTVANAVDEPEAVDDYASTQQATGVTVNLIANDGSPTGAPLRLLDVGAPSQGSVVIGSSAVTYTPSTSFVGTERLAYWVDDGAQDLRHYWRMDGNLQDQVGGLNGSTTGTVATVDGRWGRAIDFGASTGRFELPDVDYGEGFSLGFWFKLDPTQTNTWQTFLGHGGWRTQNSLDIAFSGPTGTDQNKLVTWVYDGNDDTSGGEIVADASAIWASGGWHHYLLTVTPGEGSRVYLDGTLAGTSSNGADGVNPNMPMVLGHNGTRSGPTVYRGAMDGLAVWGHALSAAERNEVTSGASARGDLFVSVSATPVTQPPAAVADTYLIAEGTSLSAATMAAPWYDTQWASRRLVSIDNVLGPQITNATLRVVLDTPALIAAGMKADGSDLRFADPDGTGLSHAVESWSSSGNSVVWVKVPVVDANSSSDRVFLYFGNPAAASVASAASVWGASAALVLNMEPNLVDLSPAATPVTQTLTTDVAGRVDRGRSFDGANSDIDLGSAAALDNIFSGGGAVSAWMHAWSWGEGGFGRIFDKASDPDSHQGWALEVQTDGSLLFEVGLTGGVARWDTPAGMLQLNQWHHVGVVFNSSTPTVAPIFYINGAPFTGIPDSVATGTATSDAGFDLHVGNHAQAPSRTFHGILDEVRVWTGSRDAGQMQAEYRSNYSATATLQPGGVQMASVLGNDRDPANLPMTVTLVSGPQHADSFGLNADGSFNYTPAPDWYGNDSFVYRASNGTLLSPPVTVTVRVANVPDAPVIMTHGQASVANLSKPENQLAVVRLEAKDVDDQNGAVTPLSWSIVGGADAALFVLDAQTGELRFAQAPDHETPGDVGADNNYQIIVQVSDGALVDQQTINITVTDVPEVARALPDTASTAWQTPVSVNVLANDLNFDSPSLGLLDISAASQGTVQMANSLATQRVVYDPGASYFGTQTLRYRLNDPLQGLQHYWRLDGDARDAIGSAHGTLINGPSAVAGTWGQALRFDGINDQVRLPDLSYSNGFTLAFWFRADDNSGTGYPTLYSHGPRGTANSLSVHFSGTGVGASAGPGMLRTWLLDGNDADDRYGLDVPAADLANGQWHLYTLVTTPGVGSEVFIDGVLRASSAVGNSAFNPSGNAWLGRTANSAAEADRMFKGDLDALALYGRSLAAEEVSGLFAGGEGEGTVSITVAAPPPLPPVISSNGGGAAAAISLAENQLAVTTVLATDPNGTPPALTYSIAGGADAARFTIDGTSGQLRFAATPDAESPWPSAQAGRYVVIVKVSDGALEDTQTLTVTVTDVDEFDVSVPADVDPELNVAAENAPPGQYVGITVAAADADATLNGITYSLIDDAGGRFVIDAVTGQVRTAAVLDAEAAAQYSIVVQARSADGSTSQASHSIDVLDVDEFDVSPPVDQDAASDALPENSAVGALVPLRVQAVDGDRTQSSVSYSLIDDAGGRFVIDALSGQVRLAAPLDAEAASSHTITVCATSADGSSSQASFSIAVNDVDEFDVTPLVDADPAVNAVSESAAVGTAVPLRAQASDPDSTNNSVSYSLVNSASGRFAIDAVTGQVRIAAALSAEAATSHLITVRATSADGSSSQASYSIAVIDVDEFDVTVPVDADPAANALAEDAAVGTAVPLRVQAIDGDLTNSSVSYSLLDDAGGRFVIDAATGQVSLAASLDAEAAASHTITVRASSADGSQSQASFTIAVNDVDEFDVSPLVDADLAANAVSESAAVGTAVPLRVQASDGDLTHSVVSYSLIDDAGGRFAIDAGTGQVSVAARLDAETVTSHTVTVRASSADGSSSQASFTIRVDDVDEFDVTAPVDADPAADALAEDAAVGTPVPLRVQAI
ncbi:MAG: DUF2341 domain-containing protein, partial [Rubrivivax sp.]|nr:DUF2341 domain-containing protein [Rubrivivax sp.]